jgi:uncharacterized Zn finger protein
MPDVSATVDCEECGTPYPGRWSAADPDQMDEAPVAVQRCPECGHEQEEAYPGWTIHTEAG